MVKTNMKIIFTKYSPCPLRPPQPRTPRCLPTLYWIIWLQTGLRADHCHLTGAFDPLRGSVHSDMVYRV